MTSNNDEGEWRVAKPKRGKKVKGEISQATLAKALTAARVDDDESLDIEKTVRNIRDLSGALRQTELYLCIMSTLQQDFEEIVVLGVGSLRSPTSKLQAALSICLTEDLHIDGPKTVFDPMFEAADKDIFSQLGFQTESANTKGKIPVSRKREKEREKGRCVVFWSSGS